jgi:hypothetical protein
MFPTLLQELSARSDTGTPFVLVEKGPVVQVYDVRKLCVFVIYGFKICYYFCVILRRV